MQALVAVAHQLVDLLSVISLVEEGKDIGKTDARITVGLVMGQDIKVLVICLDKEHILCRIFGNHSLLEVDISQPQHAVGVSSDQLFAHESELVSCFVELTKIHEHLALEAVLVDWCFGLALAGLVYPVQCPVCVTTSSSKVS